MKNMLQLEIQKIQESEKHPPHTFRIFGGLLEKIIENKNSPSRSALIWQNAFFGKATRKHVRIPTPFHAVNSPLYLHPEILEEILKFVFLPKEVADAYRKVAKKKSDA